MNTPPTWPRTITGNWRATHRLIPATYVDQTEPYVAALIDPDTDDRDADISALTALSAATNTRLQAQADVSGLNLGTHELVYDLDYSTFINAAYTYPGTGARFHDATRGAWYAALDIDTCLAEVAHHKTQHLAEINIWHDHTEYQDFTCDIGGHHFADLTDNDPRAAPALDPHSYAASQTLAADLLARGAAGIVWPSVRHPGGTCIVCFRPALLPPVDKAGRWRLEWTGSPTPQITQIA